MTTLVVIEREAVYDEVIIGSISFERDGREAYRSHTLELPWRNNERNVSCVPAGTYELLKRDFGKYYEAYKRRWNHQFSLQVDEVPDRGDILIHTGNTADHTRGCILVGDAVRKPTGGVPSIGASRNAYARLMHELTASPLPWMVYICGGDTDEDESEPIGERVGL